MHVATENVSAMLDGPTSKIITATIPAIVCEYKPQLYHSIEYYQGLWEPPALNTTKAETWTVLDRYRLGMLMPKMSDNTNHIVANWDKSLNESFGSHLWQYSLSRRNYTASWHVSRSSVKLINAAPTNQQELDDHCLLRSSFSDLPDLFIKMLSEYDWRYRADMELFYKERIKNDATIVANMMWSRIAALTHNALVGVINGSIERQCGLDESFTLFYDTDVTIETVTVTMKPDWAIAMVIALYPLLLIASLMLRIIHWPRSPIGDGFGLISLLASADRKSQKLLDGAGLSGKLSCPVQVCISVSGEEDDNDGTAIGKITSSFGTGKMGSGVLKKGLRYS